MKKGIQYIKGDVTQPIGGGKKVILHVVNNIGLWGAGFVLVLSNKWEEPERVFKETTNPCLGDISIVPVTDNISVINMYAQNGVRSYNNPVPIDYKFLEECLYKVYQHRIKNKDVSIHMPKIGCGLAGGNWSVVSTIIERVLINNNVDTYVYELP